ncbi:superoxide dismutase [Fe] [Thermincola ferriacetica]|uniref:Superoxide dismutase n=1 Tax=Thermincola ferriacetica TaxID=281456 RepID=A0A0L6W6G0_9FIRM|nr:Fe-Mn family superoxide dismutase [Thermincola ferriacetica]KNZ70699.1 superoxide dismutase [Fe] [Thermincola ferriacetica]
MHKEIIAKPLKPELLKLDGISTKQITEHYEILYKGYVKTTNEIRRKLSQVSRENQNPRYTEFRELKVEETFNLNGVVLHELYFNNLGGDGGPPIGKIRNAIIHNFGSIEKWEEDFKAAAASSRGWVVLAYDFRDKRLHNFLLDAHNVGVIQSSAPVLIIDVYEHAYFIDYGAKRAPYIDAFMKNIDWGVVNHRFETPWRE